MKLPLGEWVEELTAKSRGSVRGEKAIQQSSQSNTNADEMLKTIELCQRFVLTRLHNLLIIYFQFARSFS